MLVPATPPQPVPVFGGFDYVTIDAQRRRVYAATLTVNPGVHTTAIDPATHADFTVWSNRDGSGDFVQKFTPAP